MDMMLQMVCLQSYGFPRLFRKYQGRSAENDQHSFSTLRLHLERGDEMFSVFFFSTLPENFATP